MTERMQDPVIVAGIDGSSEELLWAVVEAAPSALVLIDKHGRIALTNAEAQRLFGYARDELLAQPIERVIPLRFRNLHVAQRDVYLAAPTKRSMGAGRELLCLHKDGRELPVEIGLSPVHVGESRYVLAAIVNITERRRAEQLRVRAARFGQDALASTDSERLKRDAAELIARVMNVPFVRIGELDDTRKNLIFKAGVGWPAEFVNGHQVEIASSSQAVESLRTGMPVFVEGTEADPTFRPSQEAIDRGVVGSAAVPIRTKEAVVGLILVGTLEPRRFSQDDLAFLLGVGTILGMAIDRARRESRITELNAELQNRIGELETFSHAVAHDLRAPLRTVAGFAVALREDHGPLLDDDAKRFIERIADGAHQMGDLIDALLSLSRVSRQPLTFGTVDLSAKAASIVADLQAADPHRNAIVEIEPGVSAAGDPALLRDLLQNLLSNAWKFTRDRHPALIRFSSELADGVTAFLVSDNGVGFACPVPDEIFKPFKRMHGREFEGTGIGLATVARIIERHGGRIWAASQPGAGATFSFTLGQ